MAWRHVASNGTYYSVPKAGHWLGMFGLLLSKISADEIPGDENPTCTANKIATFLREDKELSFVDLSYLKNKATLK